MVHGAAAAPALALVLRTWLHRLGPDPLHTLVHGTGWWAMLLLLASLSITPMRRVSVWLTRTIELRYGRRWADWNALIRLRRPLGLWAFAYALAHAALHLCLDAGSAPELLADAVERPFIALGLLAWLLLLPLALTSTQGAIRRLRKHWTRLHRLVYPAAALVLAHAWMQTKVGHAMPVEALVWALLLALARLMRSSTGASTPRRPDAMPVRHPPR